MDLTTWVDVGIGISVVYLGVSLFVTIVNEYVVQLFNLRGKKLTEAFLELIDDDNVRASLKTLPPFEKLLDRTKGRPPSYVDPMVLAHALLGAVTLDLKITDVRERWTTAIGAATKKDSSLRRQLLGIVNGTADHAKDLTESVSDWVDRSLTMLGEGYKQWVQLISLGIGFVIAGSFNIDTIALTSHLYQDKEAREAAAMVGERLVETTNKQQFDACVALSPEKRREDDNCKPILGIVDAVQGRNASLGKLPIGWSPWPSDGTFCGWALRVLGWVLTALSVSLGAPFWFDLLNRFVSIRHGMKKPSPDGDRA